MKRVIKIGKIADYIEKVFDEYRADKITLQQLIIRLCGYADTNIRSVCLWDIFAEQLDKQFDDEGNIRY